MMKLIVVLATVWRRRSASFLAGFLTPRPVLLPSKQRLRRPNAVARNWAHVAIMQWASPLPFPRDNSTEVFGLQGNILYLPYR